MCNELIYPEFVIYGTIYGLFNETLFIELITVIEKPSVHSEESSAMTVNVFYNHQSTSKVKIRFQVHASVVSWVSAACKRWWKRWSREHVTVIAELDTQVSFNCACFSMFELVKFERDCL